MGTNAIPRRESVFDAAQYNFGNLQKLENPKIAQAFQKDGVTGVLKLLTTDSEYIRKDGQPLEERLIKAAGRNVMAALDDIGHVALGAFEALTGGVVGPVAGVVAMFDALPESFWIGLHGLSNGAEAFKHLDKHVQQMRKEGKWSAHEALWAENKEAIQRNWESIKDQKSWKVAADGFECFVTGVARMAYTAPSAALNAAQAVAQTGGAVGVAVARPIGIAILEFLHLAKPLGMLFKWVGEGLIGGGELAHSGAKALAKNTPYANIPGLGDKPAGKGLDYATA